MSGYKEPLNVFLKDLFSKKGWRLLIGTDVVSKPEVDGEVDGEEFEKEEEHA